MEVDVLAMGTPSVNRFQNSLALHEALEADDHIKGAVEGLWRFGMITRAVSPAAHEKTDYVAVRNIPTR